jgi:hypothetical protein
MKEKDLIIGKWYVANCSFPADETYYIEYSGFDYPYFMGKRYLIIRDKTRYISTGGGFNNVVRLATEEELAPYNLSNVTIVICEIY